ncbi:RNA-guided endonuclease TnpB family protein, partial [Halocatena pleomorpha]
PAQESLWADLLDGDVSVGEFRLQEHRTNWVLHVTVEYEVAEPDEPDDATPVGFDIGESKLLTGCALTDNGTPTQPYIYDGGRARHLRKEMHTTLKRLQECDAAPWRGDERFDHYQNALTDIIEKASREAVEYARQFDSPVIVLEDLSNLREGLDYGKWMNRRLHNWTFARLAGRIEDKARDAGIPVRFVNPAYTSQTCHACGHIGSRRSQAAFRCTNAECWVSEYQADINATANIAGRVNPWGESLPWKSAGRRQNSMSSGCQPETASVSGDDDSPQDGSACDSTTGHREKSRQSRQTTLAAFQF